MSVLNFAHTLILSCVLLPLLSEMFAAGVDVDVVAELVIISHYKKSAMDQRTSEPRVPLDGGSDVCQHLSPANREINQGGEVFGCRPNCVDQNEHANKKLTSSCANIHHIVVLKQLHGGFVFSVCSIDPKFKC